MKLAISHPMGAFRNAVKRKTHKERAQPLARRKYGLLEKKKDYRLRAKDFHKKDDQLKLLRRKAEEKNPDEFYFGMQNAVIRDGLHIKQTAEANKYTTEELRLMKTQDLKYIALKAQTDAKHIEQLQQRLHLIGGPVQAQHTVFIDRDEASAEDASDTEAEAEDIAAMAKAGPDSGLREAGDPDIDPVLEEQLDRSKAAAYKKLIERTKRQQKLLQMAQDMALQKELMGKGGNRKLKPKEPDGKPIYKWNLVRKR